MMFKHSNTMLNILTDFGLSGDEAKVYMYLSKYGISSALKISKEVHMDRARVYRILDKLISRALVIQRVGDRGFLFEAGSTDVFEMLVKEKEAGLSKLRQKLPELSALLDEWSGTESGQTSIRYYKGEEGLKQVTWNSLRAEGVLRIMEVSSDMSDFLDQDFSEEVRKELVKRKIHVKQLTNFKEIAPHTKVTKLVEQFWEIRHLPPGDLKIGFETLLYNDTVALYSVESNAMFCVEIEDKRLAKTQRDIFDYIWKHSLEMEIVSSEGKAVLKK
jgi:sugar-specific transcriptional regulator TrmB